MKPLRTRRNACRRSTTPGRSSSRRPRGRARPNCSSSVSWPCWPGWTGRSPSWPSPSPGRRPRRCAIVSSRPFAARPDRVLGPRTKSTHGSSRGRLSPATTGWTGGCPSTRRAFESRRSIRSAPCWCGGCPGFPAWARRSVPWTTRDTCTRARPAGRCPCWMPTGRRPARRGLCPDCSPTWTITSGESSACWPSCWAPGTSGCGT